MKFKNIGPINHGKIEIGNLTVLCGGNNQGKTYITYALYGILKEMKVRFESMSSDELKLFAEGATIKIPKEEFNARYAKAVLDNIKKRSTTILNKVFNTTSSDHSFSGSEMVLEEKEIIDFLGLSSKHVFQKQLEFEKDIYRFEVTEVDVQFSCIRKKEHDFMLGVRDQQHTNIYNLLFSILIEEYISPRFSAFYIPAERTGINVFAKELNNDRARVLESINNSLIDEDDVEIVNSLKKRRTPYPQPVDDYVKYLNSLNDYDSKVDETNDISEIIRNQMVGGKFGVDSSTGSTYFKMQNEEKISLHMASSSAKSLYGLDYYIDNLSVYDIKNYLIIDEPEINLHPSNQIEFAVLINALVKKGLNVIISTHSDFLMKKLLNIALRNKIERNDGVKKDNTKVYEVSDGLVTEIDFFNDEVSFDNFDKNFDILNQEYMDLLDQLLEEG